MLTYLRKVMSLQKAVYAFLVLFSSVHRVYPNLEEVTDIPPWDLLIFTQRWLPTACKEWKEQNPKHSCNMPTDEDTWTVHGVWPTKLHTIGPAFCNRTWHFDPEAIKPIEGNLLQFWTNIETGTSAYSLWAHEWTKHGTCAAILEPLNSEFKYFSKGLELLKTYSMLNILKDAGITPSDLTEYNIKDINSAVVNKLGFNPAIECRKLNGKSHIVEIRICFDKNLKLASCDGIVSVGVFEGNSTILTNCNIHEGIIYPEHPSIQASYLSYHRLIVQFYKLVTWLQWFTL